MKRSDRFLYIGIAVSAAVHLLLFGGMKVINDSDSLRKKYKSSYMVQVQPKPEPVEEKKPEPPKEKPKPPKIPPNKEKPKEPVADAKPVFGVTKETVAPTADAGIGVRVGNTLMKEQEKEYTPPEKVQELAPAPIKEVPKEPEFKPVPVFKIAKIPRQLNPEKPLFPKKLKEEEFEGEVILKVSINKKGEVVAVKVVSSDHQLFADAALAVARKWRFTPAILSNGEAVDTVVDIPVEFKIDE